MSDQESLPLHAEWATLQHDFEGHERVAIGIKLSAVALTLLAAAFALPPVVAAPLLLIVWIIEAMVRTVQARLGARILKVETLIADGAPDFAACQLHSEWQADRQGVAGLLREYAAAAGKPTVAFVYVLLLASLLLFWRSIAAQD